MVSAAVLSEALGEVSCRPTIVFPSLCDRWIAACTGYCTTKTRGLVLLAGAFCLTQKTELKGHMLCEAVVWVGGVGSKVDEWIGSCGDIVRVRQVVGCWVACGWAVGG